MQIQGKHAGPTQKTKESATTTTWSAKARAEGDKREKAAARGKGHVLCPCMHAQAKLATN